jgi:hypothetical protein
MICVAETGEPVRIGMKLVFASSWFAETMCTHLNEEEGAGTYAVHLVAPGGLSWFKVDHVQDVTG